MKTGLYYEEVAYGNVDVYPLDLALIPKMGASISVAGTGLVGSIGLFLKVNGQNCALTCQHVAMDSTEAFSPSNGIEITILQPGEDDLENYEAAGDMEIEGAQLVCERYGEQGYPPANNRQENEHKTAKSSLKDWTEQKVKMAQVKLPFGVVNYAPGKKRHMVYNCLRDWALIKLSDERFQELPPNIVSYYIKLHKT